MFDINVTIKGDRITIEGLQEFAAEMPGAVRRGLKTSVRGMHRSAFAFLSGAGGASKKARLVGPISGRKGFTKKSGEQVDFKVFRGAGGWPVPVRTGNLRRLLDWVDPGSTVSSNGQSFVAGPMEAVLFDSAEYADIIRSGRGSSAKFGARDYLTKALDQFNQAGKIAHNIEDEIKKVIDKRGQA